MDWGWVCIGLMCVLGALAITGLHWWAGRGLDPPITPAQRDLYRQALKDRTLPED